ncbi:MAG: molybdopterin-dependent oxidoreductase [bacterium]
MEEEKLTYCRICEPMCGLKVTISGKRVLGIRGDREHLLSRGRICRRGVAFSEVHHDPDRLRHPMRRGPDGLERIPWGQALGEVAARLDAIRTRHGPDAIALYMGNPMAFCTYGTLAVPAFVKALGTRNFFSAGSQDANNKFVAAREVLGSSVLQPLPDLDHVHYLLLIGANPVVSGMSFIQVPRPAEALQRIRRKGGRVVVVDPRRTETARLATEHLFIRPDSDYFFLASLLCVLMEEGRWDRRLAARDPGGFEALGELVRRWPPEKTEAITGIPAEKTREIARDMAGPQPAAAYGSLGINLGRSGTLNFWLLLALNLLAGHFDRKGGSLLCRGVIDLGAVARLTGMDQAGAPSRIGGFRPVLGTYPAALLAHEILGDRDSRIRALVVVAGNPLLSVPNELRLQQALKRLELLVCLDLYENETGSLAHYLLPTTDFLEREDLNLSHTGLQLRRFAAFAPAVVKPDAEQLPEWEILQRLADELALPMWGKAMARLLRAAARLFGAVRGRRTGEGEAPVPAPRLMLQVLLRTLGEVRFAELRRAPRGLLLAPHAYGRSGRKVRWALAGNGLRIRLAPEAFLREAWAMEGRIRDARCESGELLLVGKRERHTHNTWMHNAPSLLGAETTNHVYLNPEDARARGIRDGDRVRVRTADGSEVVVPCRLSSDMNRKVVALPHGWGHTYPAGWHHAQERSGVNVNRLTSDAVSNLETFAGMAWMNGLPVNVERIRPESEITRKKRRKGG